MLCGDFPDGFPIPLVVTDDAVVLTFRDLSQLVGRGRTVVCIEPGGTQDVRGEGQWSSGTRRFADVIGGEFQISSTATPQSTNGQFYSTVGSISGRLERQELMPDFSTTLSAAGAPRSNVAFCRLLGGLRAKSGLLVDAKYSERWRKINDDGLFYPDRDLSTYRTVVLPDRSGHGFEAGAIGRGVRVVIARFRRSVNIEVTGKGDGIISDHDLFRIVDRHISNLQTKFTWSGPSLLPPQPARPTNPAAISAGTLQVHLAIISYPFDKIRSLKAPANVLKFCMSAPDRCSPPLDSRAATVSSGSPHLNGQIEVKTGALPALAHDVDLARVQFEYSLGDSESQTH